MTERWVPNESDMDEKGPDQRFADDKDGLISLAPIGDSKELENVDTG